MPFGMTLVFVAATVVVVLSACSGSQPAADQAAQQPDDGDTSGATAQTASQPDDTGAAADYLSAAGDGSSESDRIEQEGRSFKIVGVLPRDAIPAIFDPVFISADEAGGSISDEDLVIGLSINGDHRAYSVPYLSRHEIVNDVVGGKPVAVTWWPLCFTGIVYAREIDGQVLSFGVSGNLIMNALVMYDRETNTFWSQFLGEAVEGRLTGKRLPLVASQLVVWGDWREQHPDTLFLDTGQDGLILDSYMSYYFSDQTGIIPETHTDDRLRSKELVVGILGEGAQKA